MPDLLPILVAALLGAVVGLERQLHQGMAGLRTNALVAAAAAAFVHLPQAAGNTDVHPASLAAAVISGIGFLGAGVILREGMNVRGLNTAATLWGSAAIGAYAGSGLFGGAVGVAGVILGINVVLRPVLSWLNHLTARFSIGAAIRFAASVQVPLAEADTIRSVIVAKGRRTGLHLRSLSTAPTPSGTGVVTISFELLGYGRVDLVVEHFMADLASGSGVQTFTWSKLNASEDQH